MSRTTGRHVARHAKQTPYRRRVAQVGGSVAALALGVTGVVVVTGGAEQDAEASDVPDGTSSVAVTPETDAPTVSVEPTADATDDTADEGLLTDDGDLAVDLRQDSGTSRSGGRTTPPAASGAAGLASAAEAAAPVRTERRWTTADLNLWTRPSESSTLLRVLDEGRTVRVTGTERDGFAQVKRGERLRWVNAEYLSESRPEPEPEGLSTAECALPSDVESGTVENVAAVHRAVCAVFPDITTYGGLRPGDDGFHGSGQAVDIMVSGDLGYQVRDFVLDNAEALGVSEIIYSQEIWTVEQASSGWRPMEDRGSTTANHFDHVHVSVY